MTQTQLVNRIPTDSERAALSERVRSCAGIRLSSRTAADLELIGVGAYGPLEGFMTRRDYLSVVHEMHLADGRPWSLPITLAVTTDETRGFADGDEIPLLDPAGRILLGVLHLEERFGYDKQQEARAVYGTTDPAHPGVAALFAQGDVLFGGRITLVARRPFPFPAHAYDPADARAVFRKRGWRSVLGFQTRNPIHRAHEYIQKSALEFTDGLFLHPLVGETKGDDLAPDLRMRCYDVLLEHYYPRDRVVLGVLPAAMRYAGPREAIFHALVRRNYGCTHFLVGRDHAGVGSFYGPYDAQRIFDEFAPGELGIIPLFFDEAFYCRRCTSMATAKTCPHDAAERLSLSGTTVRTTLRAGLTPPPEFTRPEVAAILVRALREQPRAEPVHQRSTRLLTASSRPELRAEDG